MYQGDLIKVRFKFWESSIQVVYHRIPIGKKNIADSVRLQIDNPNGFVKDGLLVELKGKELYLFRNKDPMYHSEFYYDEPNDKMYMLEQGMWFIINEDYKNITPKENGMFEAAESYRNMKLGRKNKI